MEIYRGSIPDWSHEVRWMARLSDLKFAIKELFIEVNFDFQGFKYLQDGLNCYVFSFLFNTNLFNN